MKNATTLLLCALFALFANTAFGSSARAQCCPGYSMATACSGVTLTKSRWCIEDSVPGGQSALGSEFCAYGDKVVSTLEQVFNIPAGEIFEFELDAQTGGAHTGTPCGHLGDGVAYDAFKGSAYGASGFWGYLLALHEAINDWTGMASPGWPIDWWADHQSAFPNLMDFHIMDTIGVANGDQNLIDAAAAQKKRFYPKGDTEDPKVVALDNVYALMPDGDGYAGFSTMFALQSGDGVRWDGLGVPNPDVKRSEYVVAYMSLAARQNVLSVLQGPGTNGGGEICNDTPDGNPSDAPYSCDSGRIDAIASAHCAVAANGKQSDELRALRSGNYQDVASGPCGASCPSECACDDAQHCVASWLGEVAADAGAGTGGSTAAASDAGMTGGRGASGSGASGTTGTSGAASTAGASGSAGARAAGSSGASSATAGASGSSAAAGTAASAGPTPSNDSTADSGCGCAALGSRRKPQSLGLLLSALALFLLARTRTRRLR